VNKSKSERVPSWASRALERGVLLQHLVFAFVEPKSDEVTFVFDL
jgi:hypothetical protein